MRNFSMEQFFEKDPTQLRVAVETDRVIRRGAASPQVEIEIASKAGKPLCYAFALEPIDAPSTSELVPEPAPPGKRWYVSGLSLAGLDAFRKSRRDGSAALQNKEGGQFKLNVTMTNVLIWPEETSSVPLRIDIALDRKDGYITLIKETAVKINKSPKADDRKSAAPAPDACAPAKA